MRDDIGTGEYVLDHSVTASSRSRCTPVRCTAQNWNRAPRQRCGAKVQVCVAIRIGKAPECACAAAVTSHATDPLEQHITHLGILVRARPHPVPAEWTVALHAVTHRLQLRSARILCPASPPPHAHDHGAGRCSLSPGTLQSFETAVAGQQFKFSCNCLHCLVLASREHPGDTAHFWYIIFT
jgi:hypothetical protein